MARIYKRQTSPLPPPPLPPAPEVDDLKERVHTVFQSPDVGQKTRAAHTRAFRVPSDPSLGWGKSRMRETTQGPKLTRFELLDEYLNMKEEEYNLLAEQLNEIFILRERSRVPSLPPEWFDDEDIKWN